ncbi:hypothetical protein FAIPA1_50160 [Frankia sp. AiPs1]
MWELSIEGSGRPGDGAAHGAIRRQTGTCRARDPHGHALIAVNVGYTTPRPSDTIIHGQVRSS